MKTLLFNGENKPKVGDTYVITDLYTVEDNGPRTAVLLEKVNFSAKVEFDNDLFRQHYPGGTRIACAVCGKVYHPHYMEYQEGHYVCPTCR